MYLREENGKNKTINNYTIQSPVLGISSHGYPNILTISGHFSAGKTEFYGALLMRMRALESPVTGVINYKMRSPRATEVLGVDYIQVDSDEQYSELLKNGDILIPYTHDRLKYGLSKKFREALENNSIPLMITDAAGLARLKEYMELNKIPNKLISFMLHTSKPDAIRRLFDKAGNTLTPEEIRDIKSHMEGFEDEFELYRNHENLFRHSIRNATMAGISKYEAIENITNRAMEIIDLEEIFKVEKVEDFRKAYVNHPVEKLFGNTSIDDLVGSLGQGVHLNIPDDVIERYSLEQKIDTAILKEAARKEIIASANYYGILSFYLPSTLKPENKKYLVDLIEMTVGLTPQYKDREVHYSRDSRFSLKELNGRDLGLIDFYISFSPYDPMKTPSVDSPIHTIAFESVLWNKSPNIEPVPIDKAKKFIEGNGISGL